MGRSEEQEKREVLGRCIVNKGCLIPRPSLPPAFDHLQHIRTKVNQTGDREGLGKRVPLFEGFRTRVV